MSYIRWIGIFLLCCFCHSVQALDIEDIFDDIWQDFEGINHLGQYPEEANKEINIYTGQSPLEYKTNEIDQIQKAWDLISQPIPTELDEIFKKAVFNKFNFGTGLVDVTFQVKDGVKYALKDSLAGYAEYQRRKTTEEMLNANIHSHLITSSFLTSISSSQEYHGWGSWLDGLWNIFGVDNPIDTGNKFGPSLLQIAQTIAQQPAILQVQKLFQALAISLLLAFYILVVLKRLGTDANNWFYVISQPLLTLVMVIILINFSAAILDFCFNFARILQEALNLLVNEFIDVDYKHESLKHSWQLLANTIGYMPAQVLAWLDVISQFLVYFFVTGLILFLVAGKIFCPLWTLALMSNTLKSSFYISFLNWLKILLLLTIIPVFCFLMQLISQEFSAFANGFLEIAVSISSFLYLPAIANIILAKSQGTLQPCFSGYQIIVDSVQTACQEIKENFESSLRK